MATHTSPALLSADEFDKAYTPMLVTLRGYLERALGKIPPKRVRARQPLLDAIEEIDQELEARAFSERMAARVQLPLAIPATRCKDPACKDGWVTVGIQYDDGADVWQEPCPTCDPDYAKPTRVMSERERAKLPF